MRNPFQRKPLPGILLLVVVIAEIFVGTHYGALPVGAQAPEESVKLPIVMYHHVLKEQARLNKYTISPQELRTDFNYLRNNGYTPIHMADLISSVDSHTPLPPKPVVITFDDGYESFYEYVYPMLHEFGFKAVFSVVGTYTDLYSKTEDHHIRYSHSTWQQLKEMQESGLVEIQNHSYSMHVNQNGRHGTKKKQGESNAAYRKAFLEDVGQMQEKCYEHLGVYPNTFTYPFGQISPEALPLIQELGFRAALICQEKYNYIRGSQEELYHLNRFNRPTASSLQTILERASEREREKTR